MTRESFREEMKELDVWPSNSMVASSGHGPVAVLIATKRSDEVLVSRVGVHPDHLRKGHASHIVMSLSHKLAVLGPERIVVEVPESLAHGEAFFHSIGFRREATMIDYSAPLDSARAKAPFGQLMGPVTVSDLIDVEVFEIHCAGPGLAWYRTRQTLLNAEGSLEGLVLASPARIEAFVLFRRRGAVCELLGASSWPGPRQLDFLQALIRRATGDAERLELKRFAEAEIDTELRERLGLRAGEQYHRLVSQAEPS